MTNFELNIPRWIYASCSLFFKNTINGRLPMYLEGQERRTQDESNFLEFRLDGPYVYEPQGGLYNIQFEINVLVASQVDGRDHHKLYKDCGVALQCFKAIPIYKLGDGPDDDQSLLECALLTKSTDQREAVRVSHFGKIDPAKQCLQSSVEGHYHFFVNG